MDEFLVYFAIIMLLAVAGIVLNQKVLHIPMEIALLILSLAVGLIFKILLLTGVIPPTGSVMEKISAFRIEDLLMDALLCFMLFSGASDLKARELKTYLKPITLFALLTTVLTACFYGGLIYLVFRAIGAPFDFMVCLLLGAIISPTDPIAATGILNKLGLPKDIIAIMEGESLFNDGTGVALFVFVKGIVTETSESGFFRVMFKELLGAIAIGLLISFLCSLLVKLTKTEVDHIIISLLAVSSCYVICEAVGCSGVIASVVCGIYFTTIMENYQAKGIIHHDSTIYGDFWSIVDKLFNYVLYIFIGISFIFVIRTEFFIIIFLMAVVVNFVTRYAGVFISSCINGKAPHGYSQGQFTLLMTWSGLKGGLSLALVMSAASCVTQQQYNYMLFVVFATILFTTIVQGLTVSKLYLSMKPKKLKTIEEKL